MNRRIMQSEQKLKDSFIALMQSVDPSEITVKELCAAAGLNRSTFYERFGYMDHLIECLIGDCLDEVCAIHDDSKALGNHKKRVSRNDIREYIGRFQSNTVLMKFCKSKVKEKYFYNIIKAQVRISMKDMPDTVGYYPAYFQNTGVLKASQFTVLYKVPGG